MEWRRLFLGSRASRCRLFLLAILIPVIATVLFVLRVDMYLPRGMFHFGLLVVGSAIAVSWYAGWRDGGAIPGSLAVYLAIFWFYLVPPYIGFLRDSTADRYRIFQLQGGPLFDAQTNLLVGIEQGLAVGALGASIIGGLAFYAGIWASGGGSIELIHSGAVSSTVDRPPFCR